MEGWIKLHRKLLGCPIADHPEYFAVFVHLLLRAQYADSTCVIGRQVIKLSSGQLVFGRIKFSSDTGVSENKVRAALDVMKSLNMITIKSMTKFSIISIVNWRDYQDQSPADNHEIASSSPAVNQQVASSSPAPSHIQESKELKESKEIEDLKDITPQAAKPSAQKKSELDYSCWPAMPSNQILSDWQDMRKRIKANVSQTVIYSFGKELHAAVIAGFTVDECLTECVARNWRGLKFEWIKNSRGSHGQPSSPKPSSPIERFMQQNYPDKNDSGPLGSDDGVVWEQVDEPIRGIGG